MKLKQKPEDFQVEELSDAAPEPDGPFAFYRLDKTGWTTPDALQAVRRRWQIDFRRLGYGGLKDRHAVTSQFFTIDRGPQRNLKHERIAVTYLGQRREPFGPGNIRANRFTITLRNMTDEAIANAVNALREAADVGVPNYFDDQRFGSVSASGEFIAREMVHGRFDRALWLALVEPYEFDPADEKRIKAILREHWNDWPACKAKLPKSHARSLVDYLVTHPTDFKGAVSRLRPELQGLYLSAYQSFLWNRTLAAWLAKQVPAADLSVLHMKHDRLAVPVRMPAEVRSRWESLTLPLPSARMKSVNDVEWLALIEDVLKPEGLTLAELKIKGMQQPFFSKGERAACLRPAELNHATETDELQAGRKKLVLRFELPRGCYATMIVKRITAIEA
jgi:tRNA pseudouridine13 synthase